MNIKRQQRSAGIQRTCWDELDVLLVQPPRPIWVLRSVYGTKARRPVPATELFWLANTLRKRGFSVGVINADTLLEADFNKNLAANLDQVCVFIFFVRIYRLTIARRAARFLKRCAGGKVTSAVLGFVPQDLCNDSIGNAFDRFIPGPSWIEGIEEMLTDLDIQPSNPLEPLVESCSYPELTGCKRSISILAPNIICTKHHCTFCEHQILKNGHPNYQQVEMPRSVDEVLSEIEQAWKSGFKSFVCLENNFLSYTEWTRHFTVDLKKYFPGIRFAIGTRLTDIISAENSGALQSLLEAGLVSVCCGLESADNKILETIKKRATVSEYEQGDIILRNFGIKRFFNFILGLNGETKDSIAKTWALARLLHPDGIQVSIAVPLPGTPLHAMAEKNGWIISKNYDKYYYYGSCVMAQPDLGPEELLQYQRDMLRDLQSVK